MQREDENVVRVSERTRTPERQLQTSSEREGETEKMCALKTKHIKRPADERKDERNDDKKKIRDRRARVRARFASY